MTTNFIMGQNYFNGISKRKGSFQDAKDIFQDALVIYHEKSQQENFNLEGSPEAYIIGIARHLWSRKFGDDSRKISADDRMSEFSVPDDYFDEHNNRLLSILQLTGRKCLSLLRAFYYDNQTIREITNAFGFSNEHSASAQKYKCIEKMRSTVEKKSLRYEDLA